MEFRDSLCAGLRCCLIGLFLIYYGLGWGLSVRLRPVPARALVMRWAFVPLLVAAAISASYMWFINAEGREVLGAFLTMSAVCMFSAIGFSIWLQRGGGKELLYVPIAFARFGWDAPAAATDAVTELVYGQADPRYRFVLSILPAVLMLLTIIFLVWATSKSVAA